MNPPKDYELPIRLVVATRFNRTDFIAKSATGRSISWLADPHLQAVIVEENTLGLAHLYNHEIERAREHPAILVFMHDDIVITDGHFSQNVREAMQYFHIAGLAGNQRRIPYQPSWVFKNLAFQVDEHEFLSGAVAHGRTGQPTPLTYFGPAKKEVKLLDGLLLIARSDTLLNAGLRFDDQFEFHFYDLDFCRQAEQQGLRMGTWPISVVHESPGNFGTPQWRSGYEKYIQKWGT